MAAQVAVELKTVHLQLWVCCLHKKRNTEGGLIDDHLYSAILHPLEQTRCGVLTALAWLVLHETAAISAQVLCTPYNHAPCHFMQSHIRKVYVCLAVTCHLHFWQNDRDLLRATAVTRGWNGYRKKSQHRKLTLENKILPPLQQGFKPATFQSRVWRSNHWAIPAPKDERTVQQLSTILKIRWGRVYCGTAKQAF